MKKLLDARKYTISDQGRFAKLSGDFNPLHLDTIKARREIFGNVVAHGIHGALHALDAYFSLLHQRRTKAIIIEKLACFFANPIYLDQRIKTYLVKNIDRQAKLLVQNSRQLLIELDVRWSKSSGMSWNNLPRISRRSRILPLDLSMNELENHRGKLSLYMDPRLAKAEFPILSKLLPPHTLAQILALSRLVGIECPGLHSIFSSFNIHFHKPACRESFIKYKVIATDPRLSMVKISLFGKLMSGTLETFYRPFPQKQPDMIKIKKIIHKREFANQRALIIGGSRGLGEVTAKIIASGGGHAVITFNRGLEDAKRVACEIKKARGSCDILQCEVSNPDKAIAKLARSMYIPSHLYYFASPKILKNTGSYNKKLFKVFMGFYVDGLFKIYRAYRKKWPGRLSIFYPSTSLLNEKAAGFAEYTEAKSKGEALCRNLMQKDHYLSILIKQLPRIATDQTIGLLPNTAASALNVMVGIVRMLNKDED